MGARSVEVTRVTPDGLVSTRHDDSTIATTLEVMFRDADPDLSPAAPPAADGEVGLLFGYGDVTWSLTVRCEAGRHVHGAGKEVRGDFPLTLEMLQLMDRFLPHEHLETQAERDWADEHADEWVPLLLRWADSGHPTHRGHAHRYLASFPKHPLVIERETRLVAKVDDALAAMGNISRDFDILWERREAGLLQPRDIRNETSLLNRHAGPVTREALDRWLTTGLVWEHLEPILELAKDVHGLPDTARRFGYCGNSQFSEEARRRSSEEAMTSWWQHQDELAAQVALLTPLSDDERLTRVLGTWQKMFEEDFGDRARSVLPRDECGRLEQSSDNWDALDACSGGSLGQDIFRRTFECSQRLSRHRDRLVQWCHDRGQAVAEPVVKATYALTLAFTTGEVDEDLVDTLRDEYELEARLAKRLRLMAQQD